MASLELSAPQDIFLNQLNTKFRAYVGGFGSGKTYVGCIDLLLFASKNPKSPQGYFGPSYPSIRDVFYPTFDEAAHSMGFRCEIRTSDKEIHFYRGGRYYGTVICRSMDRPESIIGFKIARALVDEIDTLPKDKAKRAWNKIIARLRFLVPGVENGVGVTTTPEGFLFVYDTFADNPKESYSMVQASTYENLKYLPDDYIPSLLETYPDELVEAYVNGNFVNLKSGTVYKSYNREVNGSSETIKDREPLHIGMDFNVNYMAASVFVPRNDGWHGVAELKDVLDTPAMIQAIKEKWPNHRIIVYPDASGKNASSKGASLSDIGLLTQAGFSIRAKSSNPLVKDRYTSVNKAFEDRKLWINQSKCPTMASCLEKQAFDDNGEPDKKSGFDHQNDATGYFVYWEMPVVKPILTTSIGFGT